MSESQGIPAVRHTVKVPLSTREAFDLFTGGISQWWPLKTHSLSEKEAKTCEFDLRVGGDLYEVSTSGERKVWGTIRALDVPNRIVFSWHLGRGEENAQEVDVTFTPSGDETEVILVHRDWEKLGEVEGLAMRNGYDEGWVFVFGKCYVESAASRVAAG